MWNVSEKNKKKAIATRSIATFCSYVNNDKLQKNRRTTIQEIFPPEEALGLIPPRRNQHLVKEKIR